MNFLFRLGGILLIAGGVVSYILAGMPLVGALLGLFGTAGSAFTQNISWMAANLEVIIPAGIFMLLFGPAPQQLLFAGGVALAAGLVMWGVLGL